MCVAEYSNRIVSHEEAEEERSSVKKTSRGFISAFRVMGISRFKMGHLNLSRCYHPTAEIIISNPFSSETGMLPLQHSLSYTKSLGREEASTSQINLQAFPVYLGINCKFLFA